MKREPRKLLTDPGAQYGLNKWLMYFWIANFVAVQVIFAVGNPLWQKISILYLADISVYACISQHYTGLVASLAGRKADEGDSGSAGG